MSRVKTPQTDCRVGVARCDITPPVGIYHRMWGAALHDRATGIHRPLTASLVWFEPREACESETPMAQLLVSLDHCILDGAELSNIRRSIEQATGVPAQQIQVTLTHTHGSGWMSRQRSEFPGGELIGPYLDELCGKLASLAVEAGAKVQAATVVYGVGHCELAAQRDFFDKEKGHAVCGFHPEGVADHTVLIGRITTDEGEPLATLVNYACHPTTLAWDNTLISPDWVGAMRETVEQAAGGLCVFLQGASGDLGPREGFVGDVSVAEKNGRQLGYAVLSALEGLPPVGTHYVYQGPVLSGTWIGTWKYVALPADELKEQERWHWQHFTVDLPYRHDLPTLEETTKRRVYWMQQEEAARQAGNELELRNCRAQAEQMTRQMARLRALTPGKSCPLPVTLAKVGDAVWVFVPGELYRVFQTALRGRMAPRPVFVTTLCGDWQPGYIPPASVFGYGIYQEVIAATSPGSLEVLIETVCRAVEEW